MLFGENDCVVCGEKFKTKQEHDNHYKKCSDENTKDKFSEEEIFDLVYNKNNY